MAVVWGAWEYAGGNGMRVGLDVTWSAVSNASTTVTATVDIWTENQYTYSSDGQVLTYGGSISGTTSYTNNTGAGGQVQRATKTYVYTYTTYGSSPGSKTFTASLSGTYNGVTPAVSVTSAIPARPWAAPTAPTSVAVSRISDVSTQISWANGSTAARPWVNCYLQRSINGGAWAVVSNAIAGSATSYTYGSSANTKYRFQVASDNTIATSAYVQTGDIYTTPSDPFNPVRTPSGSDQIITWDNTGVGYTEYASEILAYKDGAYIGIVGTVATGIATFTHTPANAIPYTTTNRWKYTVRHKTTAGVQAVLYSLETGFTSETAGVTSTPNAPTALSPNGIVIDPSVVNPFTWQHNPTDASAQTHYEVQWRLAGGSTWTTTGDVTSGTSSNGFVANTFTDGTTIEWQVRTKGADASWSPWATPVTASILLTPLAPDSVKLPMLMDLGTGKAEASSTAYELRNYVQRIQARLSGGGVKDVDASYGCTWSQRFIGISLGRSATTFPQGHHDIDNPHGQNVTNKALTSNVATLTYTVYTNGDGLRLRVGEKMNVTSVGAPFDGTWTIREVTWNGTSGTVKYDCVAANVTSVASGGAIWPLIQGKGGASDSVPSSGLVSLQTWGALYYDLPFGWGGGTTPRKNGVVSITSISLTSNVITANVTAPHYFATKDRVVLSGCGAPYDGEKTVTEVGSNFIKFALTNANIGSTSPAGALAIPSGKDTFFGNFYQVLYTGDFVVPDTWLLIALRNGDTGAVEWASGESGSGWTNVTFTNGWVNYGTFQGAQYRKVGDMVQLRGLIKSGTAGASAFTLPAGYRPPLNIILTGGNGTHVAINTGAASAGTAHTHPFSMSETSGRIDINTTGTVTPSAAATNNWICLDGLSFSITP